MNNMTDEQAKEFNLACAEYMGLELAGVTIKGLRRLYFDKSNRQIEFNPAHDSNDLDLVIEKMKMSIVYKYNYGGKGNEFGFYRCYTEEHGIVVDNQDRTTAIIKCIQQVLRGKV